jgi:AcrR family transcriptional regulator
MRNIEESILDTCRTMIDEGGVESISVRKLVDACGCSLRSLYNKFENLGAVYRALINRFTAELADHVLSKDERHITGDDALHAVHAKFLSYFLDFPNRFSFIYLHKHDLRSEPMLFESTEFQARMSRSFEYLARDGNAPAEEVDRLRKGILYGMFGLLTFHATGNFGMPREAVLSEFRAFFHAQLAGFRGRAHQISRPT